MVFNLAVCCVRSRGPQSWPPDRFLHEINSVPDTDLSSLLIMQIGLSALLTSK